MQFKDFFDSAIGRIDYQLKLFEAVKPGIFNKTVIDNTWSPDAIFRHILWSINGLMRMAGFDKMESIPQLPTGSVQKDNIGVEDIRSSFNELIGTVRNRLSELSTDQLNEERTTFFGTKTTLEGQLVSAILHTIEHVGELRWQFKRLTGWTDKQVYSLKA